LRRTVEVGDRQIEVERGYSAKVGNPFRPAPRGETANNAVLGWYKPHFGDYAEFYRRAAGCLVDDAIAGRGLQDQLAYPIVYLYRHALELALKDANLWADASIRGRIRLGIVDPRDDKTWKEAMREMQVHGLTPLVDRLALRLALMDGAEPVGESERATIAAVDAFDRDGQRFRYPFLTKGRGSAWRPESDGQILVDLRVIKDEIDPVVGLLVDGYGGWLSADTESAVAALGEELAWANADQADQDWQDLATIEAEAVRRAWDESVASGSEEEDLDLVWRDRSPEMIRFDDD
jgi:hypothetical protein